MQQKYIIVGLIHPRLKPWCSVCDRINEQVVQAVAKLSEGQRIGKETINLKEEQFNIDEEKLEQNFALALAKEAAKGEGRSPVG